MRRFAQFVNCCLLAGMCGAAAAQTGEVTATVHVTAPETKHGKPPSPEDVVVWLTPLDGTLPPSPPKPHVRLVQKNKSFSPHLLVVPAGTSIEFPNLDPFFHNVFSLFNGKRFDLGLYEAGTHKSVSFDREGVSYIFCNIHPEMGAVVVALRSPYYAVSGAGGGITLHDVPPGRYRLHIWAEQLQLTSPEGAERTVQVAAGTTALGTIEMVPGSDPLSHHKNKFGEDYPATPTPKY